MKRLAILIWMLLSTVVFGQTVEVKSGEHGGFTRLVLELPKAADWQLGRTAEGYALQISGEPLQFDVTGVFANIQRNRLAAIWTDPVSGALRVGVACACHAIAFEFRPEIIVVDLRDGPPPRGSSFELALDGTDAPDLTQRQPTRPRARPGNAGKETLNAGNAGQTYDWLASVQPDAGVQMRPGHVMPISTPSADLRPLKDGLLRQLSEGAAQGLVQMAQPKLAISPIPRDASLGPRVSIRIGDIPGFVAKTRRDPEQSLIKNGAPCIADDRLDVSGWASEQSVFGQLAEVRSDLVGEFDRPNPESVVKAVRFLIGTSFGAEARQMLEELPVNHPDLAIWYSMAKLVDGDLDSTGPFTDMQTCDTAAALWAVLAIPALVSGQKVNSAAVMRGFSALPTHLRRSLGPPLAAKFLAMCDIATSQSLSNAALRGATATHAPLAVMTAKLQVATGEAGAASVSLQPNITDAGPATADVLIALVDAKIAAGEPIGPEVAVALAAFVHEQKGSDLGPAAQRAQILALGASGDFDQAFALLPKAPAAEVGLWKLLADSNSDSAIISHAVLPASAILPQLSKESRREIARHLMSLDLSDAALVWIGPFSVDSTDADKLLAAKAHLSRGQPAASLEWLSGVGDSAAANLRAQAFSALGQTANAIVEWEQAGNADAKIRAQRWAQNWNAVAADDASPWQSAAAVVVSEKLSGQSGPLAAGNALVAESAAVRATLNDLLAAVSGLPTDQ